MRASEAARINERDIEAQLIRLKELYGNQQYTIESLYRDYVKEHSRAEDYKFKYEKLKKYYRDNVVNVTIPIRE